MDDLKESEELMLEICMQLSEINRRIDIIAELIKQKKSDPSPESDNLPF